MRDAAASLKAGKPHLDEIIEVVRQRRNPFSSPLAKLFDNYEEFSPASRTSSPLVCETATEISLHFELPDSRPGTSGVQSLMSRRDPARLMLGYTRTMMRFLQFHRRPKHIGMVGLGGGSLAKYCHKYLRYSRISVAEISPEILSLRRQFRIPPDGPRFQVHCEDGVEFVKRHRGEFDVLLIDGFDNAGQPLELCTQDFYDHCNAALTPAGTLVVNICDGPRSMLLARLKRSFDRNVLTLPGEESTNIIAFAGNLKPRPRNERTPPTKKRGSVY